MLAMSQNEHQHQDFFEFGNKLSVDEIYLHKIQHNPNMDEKWLLKIKTLFTKLMKEEKQFDFRKG